MNPIRTPDEFHIDSAPFALDKPLHVGRPNIGSRKAFLARVNRILDNCWLTNNGPMVQELELRISEILGVKHCVAMCNGTIALEIAIRALDLGGEVIVPSWTFIATAHALSWQGITPIFADIDPATHNLDPDAVRRMITPRTTGIIGVHLWGRPAPVDELQAIADEHGLQLLFDAAHAFGSAYQGHTIGCFGRCEVFSFHATKAFNTMEGGAVVTNDDEMAETIRLMRNFGFKGYDNVIHPGTNGKMPEINAAMGLVNLDALPGFVQASKQTYDAYKRSLAGIDGTRLIEYDPAHEPSYHYVTLEVDDGLDLRDRIVAALHARNILARKYFWPGCHRMKPYRDLQPHAGLLLPNTEAVAERVIVLPNGPSVTEDAIAMIGGVVRDLVAAQH